MQKKWKIMIILLTILIILYALTSCKEKIQEKKGNEDNWKVYQQLEEKEEQNIQNPFIREETKCILTEKEKQELRNQLLKIVTQCKDIYHPIIDQTTGYQSISREEVKKIKKRFGENGLVCVAENMNMENYEKVEVAQFAGCVEQARTALNFSGRMSSRGPIFYYLDYAFFAMLSKIDDEDLVSSCCHPALEQLASYDAQKGMELFDTLRAYTDFSPIARRKSK